MTKMMRTLVLVTGMLCSVGSVQAGIFDGHTFYGKVVDYECNGIDDVDKFGFRMDWSVGTLLYGIVYHFSDHARTYHDGTFRVGIKKRYGAELHTSTETTDKYRLVRRPRPVRQPNPFNVYGEKKIQDYLHTEMRRNNPVIYYVEPISKTHRATGRILQHAELLLEPGRIKSPAADSSWGMSYRVKESLDGKHHWTLELSMDDGEEGGLIEIKSGIASRSENLPTEGYVRQVSINFDSAFRELETVRKEYYFKAEGGRHYGLMVIEFSLNTPNGPAFNIYYDYLSSIEYEGIIRHPSLPKYICGGALSVAPDGLYSHFPGYNKSKLDRDARAYAESLAEKARPRYIMRSRIEEDLTQALFDQVLAMKPNIPREYCRSIILRSNATSEMLDKLLEISTTGKRDRVGCSADIDLVARNDHLSPAAQDMIFKHAVEHHMGSYYPVTLLAENPSLIRDLRNKMLKLDWTLVKRLAKNSGLDKDVQIKIAKHGSPDPRIALATNPALFEAVQLKIVDNDIIDELMALTGNPVTTTYALDYMYQRLVKNIGHSKKEFEILDHIIAHPHVGEKTLVSLSHNEDEIVRVAAKERLEHGVVLYPGGYPKLTEEQMKQRESLAKRLTRKSVAERDRKLRERLEKGRTENLIINRPKGIEPLLGGNSLGDSDNDGVPDYADFKSKVYFAPLNIRVPERLDIALTKLRIKYAASPPLGLKRLKNTDGKNMYFIPPGTTRIWTKQRDPRPVNAGGDYVDSDTAYPLELFSIDDTEEGRVFSLYIEHVRSSTGFINVQMEWEEDP